MPKITKTEKIYIVTVGKMATIQFKQSFHGVLPDASLVFQTRRANQSVDVKSDSDKKDTNNKMDVNGNKAVQGSDQSKISTENGCAVFGKDPYQLEYERKKMEMLNSLNASIAPKKNGSLGPKRSMKTHALDLGVGSMIEIDPELFSSGGSFELKKVKDPSGLPSQAYSQRFTSMFNRHSIQIWIYQTSDDQILKRQENAKKPAKIRMKNNSERPKKKIKPYVPSYVQANEGKPDQTKSPFGQK